MKTSMTLARALKEKSRLIAKIGEIRKMVIDYNAVDLGIRRPVSVRDIVAKAEQLRENLFRIKTAIDEANVPISRQLIEMMSLRTLIAYYQQLDTAEVRTFRNHDDEDVKVTRDVVINQVEVLQKVAELQEKVERLQDEVDEFNATHRIEVELLEG